MPGTVNMAIPPVVPLLLCCTVWRFIGDVGDLGCHIGKLTNFITHMASPRQHADADPQIRVVQFPPLASIPDIGRRSAPPGLEPGDTLNVPELDFS